MTVASVTPTRDAGLVDRRRLIVVVGVLALIGGALVALTVRHWQARKILAQARAARTQNDLVAAASAYRLYLQYVSDNDSVRLEFAETLTADDAEAALTEFRQISVASSEYLAAARQVAGISLKLGRDYDAIGPLMELERRFPEDGGVQLALAEIRFRERQHEIALAHAQRCVELRPTETAAYLLIAECLDELKRPTEMIEPLEAAMRIDPQLPQARVNLGYALQLAGKPEAAEPHVRWFVDRFSDTAAGHRILAHILQSKGQHEEALKSVRRALQIQPRNLEAGLLEVELLLFLRQAEEAYRRATELVDVLGSERRLLTVQVRAAALSGQPQEAARLQAKLSRLTGSE